MHGQQMQLAKALYDNIAETSDELAFCRGDVLSIVERDACGMQGWWLCSFRGRTGLAPGNRLKVLPSIHAAGEGYNPTTSQVEVNWKRQSLLVQHHQVVTPQKVGNTFLYESQDYDVPTSHYAKSTPLTTTTTSASPVTPAGSATTHQSTSTPRSTLGMDNLLAYESQSVDDDYCVPQGGAGSQLRPWSDDRSSAVSELSTLSSSIAGSIRSSDDISANDLYDFPSPSTRLVESLSTPVNEDDNDGDVAYAVPVERFSQVSRDDSCCDKVDQSAVKSCDLSDGYETYDTPNVSSNSVMSTVVDDETDTLKRTHSTAKSLDLDIYDTPVSQKCSDSYDLPDKLGELNIYSTPEDGKLSVKHEDSVVEEEEEKEETYDVPVPAVLPRKVGRKSCETTARVSEVYDVPPQVSRDTASDQPSGASTPLKTALTAGTAVARLLPLTDNLSQVLTAVQQAKNTQQLETLASAVSVVVQFGAQIVLECGSRLAVRQLIREIQQQMDKMETAAAQLQNSDSSGLFDDVVESISDALAEFTSLIRTNIATLFASGSCKGKPPRPPTKPKPRLAGSRGSSMESDMNTSNTSVSQPVDMSSLDMFDPPPASDRCSDAAQDEYDYVRLASTPTTCVMRQSDTPKSTNKRVAVCLDEECPTSDSLYDSPTGADDSAKCGLSASFRTQLERLQRESTLSNSSIAGTVERKRALGAAEREVIRFYAAQMATHEGVLLDAVDVLFACIRRSQPPRVFVAYSRCVVLAAHTLVYVGDAVGRAAADTPACEHVTACTRVLCDCLRAAVRATKHAALHFPAVVAVQAMIDRVVDVSHAGNALRLAVERAATAT